MDKKIKMNKKTFTTMETILLVVISLFIGLSIGFLLKNTSSNSKSDKYLNEFIENYNYILDNYYKKIDKESLINNAIAGMMDSLDDPHSQYFDKDESDNFSKTLNGSYQGLGIQILKDESTGYMLITAIFKDSPASKANLKPGDYIISINDKKAEDMTASEFSMFVSNSSLKKYTLKIKRDNDEILVDVDKSIVNISSVTSKYIEKDNKKIGYIYIGIFANNTYKQFKDSLKDLEEKNIDALIIDVRGNSGGHLTTVDGILDIFLNSKQKMYGMQKNNKKTYTYGTGNESKTYPIILLGDESSASASEVLIAGLKYNLNSTFIGKNTYGKGTVQELVTLSDNTQYKITVKRWLTPKGKCVSDTKGIKPDIDIDLDEKYYQTLDDDDDTQLQKAIEYIISK